MDATAWRRVAGRAAALAAAAALAVLPAGIRADQVSDAQSALDQAKQQLQQEQQLLGGHQQQSATTAGVISRLQASLAQYATQEDQLRALIAKLAGEIDAQSARVAAAQARLTAIEDELAAAQRHLDDARARLSADRATLAAQVKSIYENPPTSTINALLSSDTFDDLYRRYLLQSDLASAEQRLAELVAAEADQVTIEVRKIDVDRQRQALLLHDLQDQRALLESEKATQQAAEAQLQQVIAADQQLLAQNEQAQRELAAEIQRDQADLASTNAQIASRQAALQQAIADAAAKATQGTGYSGPPGQFIWPEPNPGLSQGFGCTSYWSEPYDPSCPSLHFHSGIDIPDPWGTPIRASAAGVVHLYYSSVGYGDHVIMSHANGFSTVYGHMSSFAVGDGAVVQQGQVIGYEGSTGNSSGPHLHFEIRSGSTPVNPLAYLP